MTDIRRPPRELNRGCSLIFGPRLQTKRTPPFFAEGATGERSGALVLSLERSKELPDSGREHGDDGGVREDIPYLQTRVLFVKM